MPQDLSIASRSDKAPGKVHCSIWFNFPWEMTWGALVATGADLVQMDAL